jgi:hypothetical protein
MTSRVTAALILLTLLLSPSPGQEPDVVAQAQAVLAAVVAGDFTKVEEQFTDGRDSRPASREPRTTKREEHA